MFRRLKNGHSPDRFAEDIQELIDQGAEEGRITPGEGEMIQSIFELGETVCREIMVPRTSVEAVAVDTPFGDLVERIINNGHTRLPVYEGDIDHIQGILIAKDLLSYWGRPAEDPFPHEIIRPPIFVPETKKVVDLLAELRAKKSHMAIILDEYGGTAGLVTLEDIIEEIIGDIHDEYDVEEEPIQRLAPDTILVDAQYNLEELAEYLGTKLPEGEYETLGGFIADLTGKVPAEEETVEFRDLVMTIKSADERKINLVEIKAPSLASNPESDAA